MSEPETKRLGVQRQDVLDVMLDGKWHTFPEIQDAVLVLNGNLHSEASISARLRDFRKARYGGYTVNRRIRRGRLFEYQVLPPAPNNAVQIGMFESGEARV